MNALADVTEEKHIGKYRVIEKLGAGSTGHVYRAHDPFRNIDVAIKLFDPRAFEASGDELTRSGFFAEAALLGKLNHPHVVQVFDAATGPTDYYIVSEFVTGGTLEDFTSQGRLMDLEPALDVIFKCLRALQYLHANGVIHRDIKPENVFVGDGTDVKLGDFGAATVAGLTHSQAVMMGSPFYMSPQRLEGAEADMQSDIFALGVLFYQLLTGKRPFDSNSIPALVYQMQSVTPPAASTLRRDVPPAIDTIISRALAPALAARYQNWDAFADDLARLFRTTDDKVRRESLVTASGRFEVLRRIPFFAAFSAVELWEIVGASEFRLTREGEILLREGETGDDFFLLIEGNVRITKGAKPIDLVQPYSTLGEIAYILKGAAPRNASATAIDDGLLVRIANAGMVMLSAACRGKLEQRFLEILATRLIDVNRRLSHV